MKYVADPPTVVVDPVQITLLGGSVHFSIQVFLFSCALSSLSLSWADDALFLELIKDVLAIMVLSQSDCFTKHCRVFHLGSL